MQLTVSHAYTDVEKIELVDGELELTPKKIYEEVWACRNFEISNLWQRSVFLGTFMLAIAAGYGVLASNMLFRLSAYGCYSRKSSTFPGLMTLNSASEIPLFGNIIHKKHDFSGLHSQKVWF